MAIQKKTGVNLVYLGTRGGGVVFTLETLKVLAQERTQVHLFCRKKLQELIPNEVKNCISIHNFNLLSPKEMFSSLRFLSMNTVINTMISPRDLFIWWYAKIFKIKWIQIIHDHKRHNGDMFPLNKQIQDRIEKSSYVICLSDFVANQIYRMTKKIEICNFRVNNPVIIDKRVKKNILILGRIKKYQGVNKTRKISELTRTKGLSWTIMGEGKIDYDKIPNNAKVINRWLTEGEIIDAIDKASIVLLPYNEATQSGLIFQSHQLNTPVVVTPVGGLPEQITNNNSGIVANSANEKDIALAIDNFFRTEFENDSVNLESDFYTELSKTIVKIEEKIYANCHC